MGVVDSELADDKFVPTTQYNTLYTNHIHRTTQNKVSAGYKINS